MYSQQQQNTNPGACPDFEGHQAAQNANVYGAALSDELARRGMTVSELVETAGITGRVHAIRWLSTGVPPRYADAVADVLNCQPSSISRVRGRREQMWARPGEGASFDAFIMGLPDDAIRTIATRAGSNATFFMDGFLYGASPAAVDIIREATGITVPEEATQKNLPDLPEERSAAGTALWCAMQKHSDGVTRIMGATGAGRQTVRAWSRSGIPKKHANIAGAFLGTHPACLCPDLIEEQNAAWVYGWRFSRAVAARCTTLDEIAALLSQSIPGITAWFRTGVPWDICESVARLIGCEPAAISAPKYQDRFPVPANEAAAALQRKISDKGTPLSELAAAVSVRKDRLMGWLLAGVPSNKSLDVAVALGCLPSEIEKKRTQSNITPQGMAFSDACARSGITGGEAYLRLCVRETAFKIWRIKGVPKTRAVFVANSLECNVEDITESEAAE